MMEKSYSSIGISSGSQLSQSNIGIPASSGSVRYRWSQIYLALPSYGTL
jgi:hypothetical protein